MLGGLGVLGSLIFNRADYLLTYSLTHPILAFTVERPASTPYIGGLKSVL
jgi:hypothetical protein